MTLRNLLLRTVAATALALSTVPAHADTTAAANTYTFDAEGVYGIKCKPHYGMGMVALTAVGEPANLSEAASVTHPGKAKKIFQDLIDTAGS